MSDVGTKKPAKWNRADFQAKNDHRYKTVSGDRCVYCLEKAVLLDHVPALYDVYKNGTEPQCKVPCCYQCNQELGARPFYKPSIRLMVAMGQKPTQMSVLLAMASNLFFTMQDWAEFLKDAPEDREAVVQGAHYLVLRINRYLELLTDGHSVVPLWQEDKAHVLEEWIE